MIWMCLSFLGDAEFAGVENAGVEISREEKVWKAKRYLLRNILIENHVTIYGYH